MQSIKLSKTLKKKKGINAMTNQPKWKLIAQMGDASPLEYGGHWVFQDTTGIYSCEAEKLIIQHESKGEFKYFAYRYCLDKCRMIQEYLVSANYNKTWQYHVSRYDEWFHHNNNFEALASYIDKTSKELETLFCSDNPIDRAIAYEAIGDYFEFENLDSYPLIMTKSEMKKRYRKAIYAISKRKKH
jgi:hypothetical protein